MFCRKVHSCDLHECLTVDTSHLGSELVGTTRAVSIWNEFFRSDAFNCTAVEACTPIGKARIIGFSSSIFVQPSFVDLELAKPRPGLNARIVESVVSGRSVVLNERELRLGNTKMGLDAAVLSSAWRRDSLNHEQVSEVQTLLAFSFMQALVGYRLNRLLLETIGEAEKQFVEASRTWRHIAAFTSSCPQARPDRSLWLVTKASGLAVPGSMMTMLFRHRDPVLGLHRSDQELLLAGLDGLTDEELSHHLGLNLGTIKKRWLCLFDRVADRRPELFPTTHPEDHDHKRGRQKRHRVLAYVREHPEELRPIELTSCRELRLPWQPGAGKASRQRRISSAT